MRVSFPFDRVAVFVFALFVLMPPHVMAEDNVPLDEIVNGFDEDDQSEYEWPGISGGFENDVYPVPAAPTVKNGLSDFSIDGHVKIGSSVNIAHSAPKAGETDWRGLSRLRPEIQIELTARLLESWKAFITGRGYYDCAYGFKGRSKFTDDVLDNFEREAELGETYIQGSLTKEIDFKLGRQIIVWGKSDNIRVTDVLNPLDLREPGITDIEDLRLPVAMSRLDYYTGDWSLTGISIHEVRFNKNPEYGSDFYPFSFAPPNEVIPSDSLRNTQYAVAVNGIFSGWDIAFYYAYYFDHLPHMERISNIPAVELKHSRVNMLGSAYNIALGNWLLKGEVAFLEGMEFFNSAGRSYSRTDILAGIEYSGFQDTIVGFEAVNRRMNNFDKILKQFPDNANKNEFQTAIRLEKDFLNETLKLTVLATTFDTTGDDGAMQRFSARYDITDAVEINGGVVLYQSGDLTGYSNIGDNDRLFLEAKYSF